MAGGPPAIAAVRCGADEQGEDKTMKQDKEQIPADSGPPPPARKRGATGLPKPRDGHETEENTRLLHELRVHQVELEMQNEELREVRLTLEAALEKYADLYDFAPMGYFTLDDKGIVLEANYTGTTLLGTVHSQLVGHRFSAFLAEPSRAAFNAFLADTLAGGQRTVCEAALWGGPPHALYVRIHGGTEDAKENEPRRCRIAVTDITALRETEQDQAVRQEQLQQSQRLESLGVVVGGIAHDFNNLLMSISGNAGLVLEEIPKDSPALPMMHEIVTVAGRAAELCAQMLACAGKGRFQMVPLDLSKMAAQMSQMLLVSTPRKTIISCRLHANLPAIRADAAQMRQVLMNLIMNASEATGDAGGSVSISTGVRECSREYFSQANTATVLKEGAYVFLEVTDTGCGMDPATVRQVFDPFFSTKSVGRGLGLSVVMGIMHAHAGGICIDTKPGAGTTVTLLFPPAQPAKTAAPAPPPLDGPWKGKGVVLVVDDEDTVRNVCRRMLENLGLDVLAAKDGREALEVYSKNRDRIRCVLLDFAMPRMNGEETFYELRKIDPTVCVLLSSGYLVEDVMARFEGQGLAGFIHKPYQRQQLAEALKKLFAE